jgi:hypothetical protein
LRAKIENKNAMPMDVLAHRVLTVELYGLTRFATQRTG